MPFTGLIEDALYPHFCHQHGQPPWTDFPPALNDSEHLTLEVIGHYLGYGMRPHDFHLTVIETGRTDVLLTFSDFNLLNQTARDTVLPAAYASGMGILNGWSIMRGYLTGVPVETFVKKEKWNEDHERSERMRKWAERLRLNLLELALQFCLRDDRVHGNPIGSLNKEQLEANVRAANATLADATFEQFLAEHL